MLDGTGDAGAEVGAVNMGSGTDGAGLGGCEDLSREGHCECLE